MNILLLSVVGLAAGFISGALGVGGGFIFVPFLYYIGKFDMHTAVGTSLAIIVPTSLIGMLWHAKCGNVDGRSALIISGIAIIGSALGAFSAQYMSGPLMRRLFAVILIIVAIKMFIK